MRTVKNKFIIFLVKKFAKDGITTNQRFFFPKFWDFYKVLLSDGYGMFVIFRRTYYFHQDKFSQKKYQERGDIAY